jgi:hypothetical protein
MQGKKTQNYPDFFRAPFGSLAAWTIRTAKNPDIRAVWDPKRRRSAIWQFGRNTGCKAGVT